MADKTHIQWTDATWNPLRGCSRVSEGCRHCYAETVAARFSGPGQPYEGLAHRVGGDPRWTGKVIMAPETVLTQPLRWNRPRRIFVNSMSDLFHESVPDAWIDRVFAVMALTPLHTYQVLTKRPERMREYMTALYAMSRNIGGHAIAAMLEATATYHGSEKTTYPAKCAEARDRAIGQIAAGLPNVWLGVSIEDRGTLFSRSGLLRTTPAALRFFSLEPLLEDLGKVLLTDIDWVIVGGESGAKARPMHPDWARSLRDQCAAAGVPFFFKQWGEYLPEGQTNSAGFQWAPGNDGRPPDVWSCRIGKKAAGDLLDGVRHHAWPEVQS